MKYYHLAIPLLFFLSCSTKESGKNTDVENSVTEEVMVTELQHILDSAKVSGSMLVFDPQQNVYYSNNFDWARLGQLPASTFKIPNSIVAIETGIVEDDSTLIPWDGEDRWLDVWEQDLLFREAFHFSCVPCYQDIARRVGAPRMNEFLSRFSYGSMDVDSTTIDNFWLEGDSRISQFQQIDFLERFYRAKLSISARTHAIMKRMMVVEQKDDYQLSGKTGWSVDGKDNGWFVGYVEVSDQLYFFATNVEPTAEFDMDLFANTRKDVTYRALQKLEII